jgi:vesicle coat complex subunit
MRSAAGTAAIVTVVLVALGVGPVEAEPPKEPKYQGRKLSDWVDQLSDYDPEYRRKAAEALAQFGPDGRSAAPAVAALLKDKNPDIVREAAATLEKIGAGGEAVPVLTDALQKAPDSFARSSAASALGQEGEDAAPAVGALIGALKDGSYDVRRAAFRALGKIGAASKTVPGPLMDALINALGDDDVEMRYSATLALGAMGKKAKPAVKALLRVATTDKDVGVRDRAVDALMAIDPEAAKGLNN